MNSSTNDYGWYRSPHSLSPIGETSTPAGSTAPEASPDTGPPQPGWWVASDGSWYPPEQHPDFQQTKVDTVQPGPPHPGWWIASDGEWYPPEQHPDYAPSAVQTAQLGGPQPGWWVASDGNWYPPEQHPDFRR